MSHRVSRLDDDGDLSAPIGSEPWAKAITVELRNKLSDWSSDAKAAGMLIKTARKREAWKPLGYASFGMYCNKELRIDEQQADALVDAKKGQHIGDIIPLAPRGRPAKGEEKKGVDNTLMRGTTNAEYLLRRLARDNPDILNQYQAGDFPSVRQAAIAAGIVKVKTPAEQAIHWLKKCDAGQWSEVVAWMNEQ